VRRRLPGGRTPASAAGARLGAVALSVVRQPQPRRRGDLPDHREVPRAQGHDAQRLFAEECSQPEPPGTRAPGAELTPVLLEDGTGPVLRVTGGPGVRKGRSPGWWTPPPAMLASSAISCSRGRRSFSREVCTVRPNKGQSLASTPRSSPAGKAGPLVFRSRHVLPAEAIAAAPWGSATRRSFDNRAPARLCAFAERLQVSS
jgi:hypothetical protein